MALAVDCLEQVRVELREQRGEGAEADIFDLLWLELTGHEARPQHEQAAAFNISPEA